MSHCNKYLEMASLCLDGELPESEEKELFEHLESCEECRKYFEAFKAASLALDEVSAPEGFAAGVMDAVRAQAPERKSVKSAKPRRRGLIARYAALAACLALVVAAGVKLALPSGSAGSMENRGKPAAFSSTGAGSKSESNQIAPESIMEDGAAPDNHIVTSATPASSNCTDSIDAITVTTDAVSTRLESSEDIEEVAQILRYAGDVESAPEYEADYVVAVEGERGEHELLIWNIDGTLICQKEDESTWAALGSAEQLDSKLG